MMEDTLSFHSIHLKQSYQLMMNVALSFFIVFEFTSQHAQPHGTMGRTPVGVAVISSGSSTSALGNISSTEYFGTYFLKMKQGEQRMDFSLILGIFFYWWFITWMQKMTKTLKWEKQKMRYCLVFKKDMVKVKYPIKCLVCLLHVYFAFFFPLKKNTCL